MVDSYIELEARGADTTGICGLYNDQVSHYSWRHIGARVPGKGPSDGKVLLDDVSGIARAGEMVAIMGPSGSGKTMLLNRLAQRAMPPKAVMAGDTYLDGAPASRDGVRNVSSYVEQMDHLIGSMTTRETILFAAKLGFQSGSGSSEAADMRNRVDATLEAFGLQDQRNTLVGTPIQKGLSGGQKRRVSVASQLITAPRILFLDEPTSGLDSVASFEIVSYLREVARANKLIVIASIHQPSTKTFNVFDKVYLIAKGRLCYGGLRADIGQYFSAIGLGMPAQTNPAEWLLELVDTDFTKDRAEGAARLAAIQKAWMSKQVELDAHDPAAKPVRDDTKDSTSSTTASVHHVLRQAAHLLHRNFIKSYRDLIAYWLRVAMYTALALLMGTTWLRLGYSQIDITARITALFFSGAFMSFMAVAYIPAYIEDQATYFKERANGLYGPLPFIVANTLIGIPYLFIIVLVFSVIAYWMVGLWPTAAGFWTFVGFLFLDLLAAESLVVAISSIVPNFIVSLALVAFANGLWMVVNGFLVPETILNVFWKSWVTKINYQNWTFQAMMWNEFHDQSFHCDGSCSFPSPDGVTVSGMAVLEYYGYGAGNLGAYAGYMIAIAFVYRLMAYLALRFRK